MQLTDSDILEFKELAKKHLGVDLTWEAAQDQAIKLVRLMQIVHRPLSVEDYEAIRLKDGFSRNKNENEYEPSGSKEI